MLNISNKNCMLYVVQSIVFYVYIKIPSAFCCKSTRDTMFQNVSFQNSADVRKYYSRYKLANDLMNKNWSIWKFFCFDFPCINVHFITSLGFILFLLSNVTKFHAFTKFSHCYNQKYYWKYIDC